MNNNISDLSKSFTDAHVAEVLTTTSTTWQPAEGIRIRCGRFANKQAAHGEAVDTDMKTWAQYRQECAVSPPPAPGDKSALPAEVGALLAVEGGKVRRRAKDVLAPSWIFIDTDSGQSGISLRLKLCELQMAFLMEESFTSRLDGNPVKWHLFMILSQPKQLSTGLPNDVDAKATLTARKDWWRRVGAHVKRALFTLGGLTPDANRVDDSTSDTLARMAYVPFSPNSSPRMLYWQPGRLLDLDAFLRATGFDEVDAPIVRLGDAASSPPGRSKAPAMYEEDGEGEGDDDADDDTDELPSHSDGGPTAGETTGSLLNKALDFFGLVGPAIEEGRKYKALCPWRKNHTPTANHDPEGFLDSDTSVTFWLFDDDGKPGGGWKCSHFGKGIDQQCERSGAADVLRWARKNGVPESILPNTQSWGGVFVETTPPPAAVTPEIIELPPEFPGAPKVGEAPKPPQTSAHTTRPDKIAIEIDEDLKRMRDLAIQAIAQHSAFFVTEKGLFDLVEVDGFDKYGHPKKPWLRKTTAPHLRAELGTVSRWFTLNRKGEEVPARPDREIASIVAAAGHYPAVRELNGIITTPVFRRDHTLIQSSGYDDKLGVIYRPDAHVPLVSASPSRAQLVQAKASLMRIVKDFPFKAGTAELARGVWLAAIFTRLLRFVFTGNVPLFAVSAGDAGSGKGKLVDAAAIISEGSDAWKRTKAGDDAEVERAIGAAIKEEVPVAVLDNIPRGTTLESATLDSYLTTPRFATREIGTSKNINATKGGWTDTLWWATGNGLQTGGDMSRRVLRIDIDDRTGDPTKRKPDIENLEAHCYKHRPELLAAALTLLAGFFAARKQGWSVKLPPFASFEPWGVVREAVVWCGLPDPFLARGKAEDDADGGDFAHLMKHLYALAGEKPMYMGAAATTLAQDHASKKPQHSGCYNFLTDAGVKLDSKGSSGSLGHYLKKFGGKTQRLANGKLVQLYLHKDDDGRFFRLDAVG